MLPHHHHEEVVCYTKTHCETVTDYHNGNYHDNTDHSHDQSSGEESQTCLSLEYYVKSGINKSNKKISCLSLIDNTYKKFNSYVSYFLYKNNEIRTKEKPFKFSKEYSFYAVFLKNELSLRGPPSSIV